MKAPHQSKCLTNSHYKDRLNTKNDPGKYKKPPAAHCASAAFLRHRGMEKGIAAVAQQTHGEFEQIIICLTTGGNSEKMLPRGVQVIALHKPAGNSLYFIFQLAKQIKALKPDVMHTRNWGGLDGIIAARLAGVRGVVHGEHGWGDGRPPGEKPQKADDPAGPGRVYKRIHLCVPADGILAGSGYPGGQTGDADL